MFAMNLLTTKSKYSSAYSLLELLLVFVVMGVIALMAVNRYHLYEQEKDIAAVRQNVNLLMQANNAYYHACCNSVTYINNLPPCTFDTTCFQKKTFCVTTTYLGKANLLPKIILNKLAPSINNYTVSAKLIGTTPISQKPIYQLTVTATLNIPTTGGVVGWYQGMLGASRVTGTNSLAWDSLPSYIIPSMQSGLGLTSTTLRQFKETVLLQAATGEQTCAY